MATEKDLSLIYEILNFANSYLRKVRKFQGNGLFRFEVLGHLAWGKWKIDRVEIIRILLLFRNADACKKCC